MHLLWKPDPKRRDQVRLSLTRSWRAPAAATLIGRPTINRGCTTRRWAATSRPAPTVAGNPDLQPELATGVDLAFERYLEGGGLLSANLFHRRISDVMRAVTLLETVPWSPLPRWVRRTAEHRQRHHRRASSWRPSSGSTSGWPTRRPVELRANVSLYRSQVDSVPGPDNRLDEQAKATANLGADYRLRGLPLTLGGNFNWVPATTTRLAADQTTRPTTKRQWDAYALWAFNPEVGLRLMANNLLPRDLRHREPERQRQPGQRPGRAHPRRQRRPHLHELAGAAGAETLGAPGRARRLVPQWQPV